jgi:hypothetical protein
MQCQREIELEVIAARSAGERQRGKHDNASARDHTKSNPAR